MQSKKPVDDSWLVARAPEDDAPWAALEKDPDAFVGAQLPAVRRILGDLRALVRATLPKSREEIKWHMLFVSHEGMLCFFDPGRDSVKFGFVRGAELAGEFGDLLSGSGRFVRSMRVRDGAKLPKKRLATLLRAAARLNDAAAKAKARRRRRRGEARSAERVRNR